MLFKKLRPQVNVSDEVLKTACSYLHNYSIGFPLPEELEQYIDVYWYNFKQGNPDALENKDALYITAAIAYALDSDNMPFDLDEFRKGILT